MKTYLKWFLIWVPLFLMFNIQLTLAAEPVPKTNLYVIYDTAVYADTVALLAKTAASRNFRTQIFSSTAAPEDETSWTSNKDVQTIPSSNEKNLIEQLVSTVREDLKSNKIQKNDQVLIQVLTHGEASSDGQTSHKVLVNHTWISLDSLSELKIELANSGVRLGIIDGACYSGASMALKSTNTCVISSQDARHVTNYDSQENGSFVDAFWRQIKNRNTSQRTSLEEIFFGNANETRQTISTLALRPSSDFNFKCQRTFQSPP